MRLGSYLSYSYEYHRQHPISAHDLVTSAHWHGNSNGCSAFRNKCNFPYKNIAPPAIGKFNRKSYHPYNMRPKGTNGIFSLLKNKSLWSPGFFLKAIQSCCIKTRNWGFLFLKKYLSFIFGLILFFNTSLKGVAEKLASLLGFKNMRMSC